METKDLVLEFLKSGKEAPGITQGFIDIVKPCLKVLEPLLEKIYVEKYSSFTHKKFQKLQELGFTRQEAFELLLSDKHALEMHYRGGQK